MEQHVFAFSLIIDGATEKVLQLNMPLKSIYNQNLGLVEQKVYFLTLQTCSNNKKFFKLTLLLSWKYFSGDLFRGAPIGLF